MTEGNRAVVRPDQAADARIAAPADGPRRVTADNQAPGLIGADQAADVVAAAGDPARRVTESNRAVGLVDPDQAADAGGTAGDCPRRVAGRNRAGVVGADQAAAGRAAGRDRPAGGTGDDVAGMAVQARYAAHGRGADHGRGGRTGHDHAVIGAGQAAGAVLAGRDRPADRAVEDRPVVQPRHAADVAVAPDLDVRQGQPVHDSGRIQAVEQADGLARAAVDEQAGDGMAVAPQRRGEGPIRRPVGPLADRRPARAAVPVGRIGRRDLSVVVSVKIQIRRQLVAAAPVRRTSHARRRQGKGRRVGRRRRRAVPIQVMAHGVQLGQRRDRDQAVVVPVVVVPDRDRELQRVRIAGGVRHHQPIGRRRLRDRRRVRGHGTRRHIEGQPARQRRGRVQRITQGILPPRGRRQRRRCLRRPDRER